MAENNTNEKKSVFNSRPFIIVKKVLWGILCAIFAALLALVIWLAIDKFILKSPVPSAFGYATLIVDTGSMESEIMIGDMILIKKTDDYKIGDIITFLPEGDTIPTTHRIINYTENGYVTKGDHNNTKDTEDVTPDIILGEVIHIFPKVGVFATWVQEEGWMYIVSCLVILALGSFIIKSDDNEEKKENEGKDNSVSDDTTPENSVENKDASDTTETKEDAVDNSREDDSSPDPESEKSDENK